MPGRFRLRARSPQDNSDLAPAVDTKSASPEPHPEQHADCTMAHMQAAIDEMEAVIDDSDNEMAPADAAPAEDASVREGSPEPAARTLKLKSGDGTMIEVDEKVANFMNYVKDMGKGTIFRLYSLLPVFGTSSNFHLFSFRCRRGVPRRAGNPDGRRLRRDSAERGRLLPVSARRQERRVLRRGT